MQTRLKPPTRSSAASRGARPAWRPALTGLLPAVALATACSPALTREEAQEAVDEIQFSSQGDALTTHSIELSTDFTLGEGARAAAEHLKEVLTENLPCAELTLDDEPPTLHIDYGKGGSCGTNMPLSGRHSISVAKNDDDEVVVDHIFESLSNGELSVEGSATVTWNAQDKTRHVVHNNTFTRLSDGHTAEGSGDRVQQALDGGIAEGFSVDGKRSWSGPRGDWELDIDHVEMRWIDPVPQAGTYSLTTPQGIDVELSFKRQDDTRIIVTVAGPRRSFDFTVRRR